MQIWQPIRIITHGMANQSSVLNAVLLLKMLISSAENAVRRFFQRNDHERKRMNMNSFKSLTSSIIRISICIALCFALASCGKKNDSQTSSEIQAVAPTVYAYVNDEGNADVYYVVDFDESCV